jgi:hypothetical protein
MTITRVIRDGVEFFTIDETGETGMSESGLAVLCGVSQQAINKLLRSLVTTNINSDDLKSLLPRLDGKVWLQPRGFSTIENTKITNLAIVRAKACAAVIEHYAFESRYKTQEAVFAYRKFGEIGIAAWIQEMTDWRGSPIPKNGITLDFDTIDQLLEKKLDTNSYRVYLIFQKAIRLRMTLTPTETMQRANIGRSAYMNAIGKLQDAQLLPDWCKTERRMHPERDVRDRLQTQLGGQTEAYTKWGLIDLLTETELIEIKIAHHWKDAIGHIIAKSHAFPQHSKRLHLFSHEAIRLDHIEEICTKFDIKITFEKVEKQKQKTATKDLSSSTSNTEVSTSLTPT